MINNSNSFKSLGLIDDICSALKDKGYEKPTEIQNKAIPVTLSGKDVIAVSQTGTGKTASFTLPIINKIAENREKRKGSCLALILVPTRELANQVYQNIKSYTKYIKLKTIRVLGGVKINPQIQELQGGTDILVATPGRLLDLFEKNAINFDSLQVLVLDEADKLLDMGFSDELNKIFSLIPQKRQNLLYSATFPQGIRKLSDKILKSPVDIRIKEEITKASIIDEWLYPVDRSKKNKLLIKILSDNNWNKVLVFARSQNRVDRLLRFLLSKNIKADSIHGKKTQSARETTLKKFKDGKIKILVATDIASRGIDIKSLPIVINYDLPQVPNNYIHRIGRTGRAGVPGLAISFACSEEFEYLVKIERVIQEHIKRKTVEDFIPEESLPDSPKIKPIKIKKKKKKKKKKKSI